MPKYRIMVEFESEEAVMYDKMNDATVGCSVQVENLGNIVDLYWLESCKKCNSFSDEQQSCDECVDRKI